MKEVEEMLLLVVLGETRDKEVHARVERVPVVRMIFLCTAHGVESRDSDCSDRPKRLQDPPHLSYFSRRCARRFRWGRE